MNKAIPAGTVIKPPNFLKEKTLYGILILY